MQPFPHPPITEDASCHLGQTRGHTPTGSSAVVVDSVSAPTAAPDSPWHMEVPPNLLGTLLDHDSFSDAQMLVGFGPSQRARWLDYWNRVVLAT